MQCYVTSLPDDLETAGRGSIDQFPGNFSLAVNHDLPPGEAFYINVNQAFTVRELDSTVRQAFSPKSVIDVQRAKDVRRRIFKYAGTYSALDVIAASPFNDH